MKKPYRKTGLNIPSRINGRQNPEYHRAHHEATRDERLKQQKEWRQRTEYKSSLTGSVYRRMVVSLLRSRDGDNCWLCHDLVLEGEDQIDHVVLRSKGGSNEAENLKLAHSWCNRKRSRS